MRQTINIYGPLNSGVAAGGAGVATNNADSPVPLNGLLVGVYIRYNDTPPAATTDVVITTKGTNMPTVTLLTITNAATDGYFAMRKADVTAANAASGTFSLFPIADIVNVNIAQANNADSIDVWFVLAPWVG